MSHSVKNGCVESENEDRGAGTDCGAAVESSCNHDRFYPDGTFSPEAAKAAYFEMMKRHGYPIAPVLQSDEFWVSDFGQHDFARVGMGGIFWVNDVEHQYFAHEIYLLPGQMIVEHAHQHCEEGKAKMESWHVRHGSIYTFGEGEETPELADLLPQSQREQDGISVKHGALLQEGEIRTLNRLEAPHFMIAGPDGAIVSEYGTPHYGSSLTFTNPGVAF